MWKSFATARLFFLDLGFSVNWERGGYAELQLGSAAFILQSLPDGMNGFKAEIVMTAILP